MFYHWRVPDPPLDASIASLWVCGREPTTHALERVLPTGAAQLIINLKEDQTRVYDSRLRCTTTAGTIVCGVRSSYDIIDTGEQEHVAGVAFRPGGLAPFIDAPAHEIVEGDFPLELFWGRRETETLRDRLLACVSPAAMLDTMEAVLRERWRSPMVHPAVGLALTAFDRVPHLASVTAVTEATGLSAKWFIERFKAAVGVTPKRYCRIRRFQQAVGLAHRGRDVDWAQVALDCGYFDQAHFIHDFRAFSGVTPTVYQASRTPYQNHLKFLQAPDERR